MSEPEKPPNLGPLDPLGVAFAVPAFAVIAVLELAITIPAQLLLKLFQARERYSILTPVVIAIPSILTPVLIAIRRLAAVLFSLNFGNLYEYDGTRWCSAVSLNSPECECDPPKWIDAPRQKFLALVPWPRGNGAYKEFFTSGAMAKFGKNNRDKRLAKEKALQSYYKPEGKPDVEASGSALELKCVIWGPSYGRDVIKTFVLEFQDGSRRGSAMDDYGDHLNRLDHLYSNWSWSGLPSIDEYSRRGGGEKIA